MTPTLTLIAVGCFAFGWIANSLRHDRWHEQHGCTLRDRDDYGQGEGDFDQSHKGAMQHD